MRHGKVSVIELPPAWFPSMIYIRVYIVTKHQKRQTGNHLKRIIFCCCCCQRGLNKSLVYDKCCASTEKKKWDFFYIYTFIYYFFSISSVRDNIIQYLNTGNISKSMTLSNLITFFCSLNVTYINNGMKWNIDIYMVQL